MAGEDVVINIRTRGGRQSARDASLTATSIRGIGRAAESAGKGLDTLGRKATSVPLRFIGSQARYAAYGLEAIGVYAVGAGLKFNASMEQNEVAFTHFLGSTAAAKKELGLLFDIAAHTPFQFADVTSATRKFIAFGFSVSQSNKWLISLGDAIAGAGLGTEAIDRAVLALGQIRSKGKLMSQDLRQLQELSIIDFGPLAKNLGITKTELANIGSQGISAARALPAIQKTINQKFRGSAAEQARTFTGQISTLRDYTSQTLGSITFPAFSELEKNVFPKLTSSAQKINKIFDRTDLTFGEKTRRSRDVLKRQLGPIVDQLGDELKRAHLGDKLAEAFEAAAPKLMNAAGKAAAKGAEAFVKGWFQAGPYGKLFVLGLIGAKFGAFSKLGGLAADAFAASWARRMGRSKLPVPGGGAAPPIVAGQKGSWLGRAAHTLGIIGAADVAAQGLGAAKHALGHAKDDVLNDVIPDSLLPHDWQHPKGPLAKLLGLAPDEPRQPVARARKTPTASHVVTAPIVLNVDGRVVAKTVARVNADTKARR